MEKQYYVYIMANNYNTVLYIGVTNDLKRRVFEHKEKFVKGFSKRYNITKLVYYEVFSDAEEAIRREKQLKGGPRGRKVALIECLNEQWRDLYDSI